MHTYIDKTQVDEVLQCGYRSGQPRAILTQIQFALKKKKGCTYLYRSVYLSQLALLRLRH